MCKRYPCNDFLSTENTKSTKKNGGDLIELEINLQIPIEILSVSFVFSVDT
ncbi:hypothetical protein CRENPOLYSF2_2560012 [Crenothrix polyspora]|uniref:Uncharacterized protein n=1 Tax=Crenothrix polyspora TaxID=360316 RepID=A0A1R4H790_9GAMM|nr:hypothetical protein CRENPOLYSF2_2560012 [Crenothrix polyspora]